MATYNIGNTGVFPKGAYQWTGTPKIETIEVVVDLGRRIGLNVPPAGYAAGDIIKVCDFPKGCYVMDGSWELLTAEGAALTFTGATTGTVFTFQSAATSLNGTLNVVTPNNVLVGRMLQDSVFTMTLAGTLGAAGGLAKIAFHFVVANQATNA
jgi:hypothetical protein